MQVSHPRRFLEKLDEETLSKIEKQFGGIDRFLGPGDTFKFTCDKSGRCCKDRFDNPILLSPYDAFRLQKNLNLSSSDFARKFGRKISGADSQLPIMLLEYQQSGNNHNKCPFLRSYGCRVYEDRPLVCRMYPVGRITDEDMNYYFFLTKTADYCQLGKGKEHSIEQWLEETRVEPYFEWNDRFNSLFLEMDHEKYKALPVQYKAALGDILYHPDSVVKLIPEIQDYEDADNGLLEIGHYFARLFVEKHMK